MKDKEAEKMVVVRWVDAELLADTGCLTKEEVLRELPESVECEILGWLIGSNRKVVIIAQENFLCEPHQFKYFHVIPRAIIKSIRELDIKTEKKVKK